MSNYLYHFNPYHDAKGLFTSASVAGGTSKSSSGSTSKSKKKDEDSDTDSATKKSSESAGTTKATKSSKTSKISKDEIFALTKRAIEKSDDNRKRSLLTDSELVSKIDRLEKEAKLKKLTEEDLHPVTTSLKKTVSKILTDSSSKALTTASTGGMLYIMAWLAKSGKKADFNRKELSEAIFNGGAKKK